MCVLEGPDLVEAALAAGCEFEALYVDQTVEGDVAGLVERAQRAGVRCFALAPSTVSAVADAVTPQPVLASVRFRPRGLEGLEAGGLILVLDDLHDPGNVGTAIRSADASGASAVVLTGHGVDPYNPKALRATAGSIFHLPVLVGELGDLCDWARGANVRTWASVVRGGLAPDEVDLGGAAAVVVGHEATGLDDAKVALCDGRLTIPMSGRAESLNAGVAASLVAFEAQRQRRGGRGSARSLGAP